MATASLEKTASTTTEDVDEDFKEIYEDIEKLQDLGINATVNRFELHSSASALTKLSAQDIKKLKAAGMHTISSIMMNTRKACLR
mgnify:CR=1 FL=1